MKLVKILTIVFCILMLLSQNTFAFSELFSTAKEWSDTGRNHAGIGLDTNKLQEGSNKIYNILLAIASIVAVIVGAMLGIKYMMAGIEEKVDVKQSLIPYFISCIVVFGSLGIWKIVITILKSF